MKNRKLKLLFIALSLLCIALLIAACGNQSGKEQKADTLTVTDLIGREVVIPAYAQRIAAMTGPSYEMVFMLGASDRINMVKSGHTTNYPLANLTNPELYKLNTVPANPSSSVNIEDYLAQNVDLVIYYENDTELKKFQSANVPAVVLTLNTGILDTIEKVKAQTLDEYKDNATAAVKKLAVMLNDEASTAEAEAWVKYTCDKIDFIYNRTKDIPEENRPTVYWGNTWGENVLATYGINNRWYEIWLSGGNLLGPEVGGGNFPEITAEQLFDWDPDIILVDNHGNYPELVIKSMMKENSKWSSLTAVKNNELHRIPAGVFFIDKGTTSSLLMLWMATFMQPELFTDVDIIAEIQYYYKEFYEYDISAEDAEKVITGWYEGMGGAQ